MAGTNVVDPATVANAEIAATSVEELELHLGSGGDTVLINGNLGSTGIATSTITVDGGTGNDTVDASGMAIYKVDVVFNGGGGNDVFKSGLGNDTFTDTGAGRAVYSETLSASNFSFNAAQVDRHHGR